MYHLGGSIQNRPCTLGRPIRNRPFVLGRPIRNCPCILGGTIQNSCLVKYQKRISSNPSAYWSHSQTSSGKNFCQDAFCLGPTILSPFRTAIQKLMTFIYIGQFNTLRVSFIVQMPRHLAAESKSSVLRRQFQTLISWEVQMIADTMAQLLVLKLG